MAQAELWEAVRERKEVDKEDCVEVGLAEKSYLLLSRRLDFQKYIKYEVC